MSIWHNNTHSAVISLVFCCAFIAIALIQICRSLGIVDPLFVPALLNWFHSEANSFHFNFNSFTLYKLAFCSGVAKLFTLYNRAFCSGVSITRCIETFCRGVTITITLCNWAFCSGVIFGLATPYNWTFCGGVTAIFTLYNWVFCGGAHRRATSLNNQIFCGGVISILTLCNWTFCSEVDNRKLSKLCCAAIVNLVLTVCRSRCHTGFNWILTFCFCEGQRRKLGLIFPWLDICSVVITNCGWNFSILDTILIWRSLQFGLHILWIICLLQPWKHFVAGNCFHYFAVIFRCVQTLAEPTWLTSRRFLSVFFASTWCRSGPKSRRPFGKIFLGLCCLSLFMFSSHLDRGEGCDPVMRVTETSADLHWMPHLPTIADVKQHDMRPPVSSVPQSRSPTQVTKRSLKRAQKRAYQHGVAWYKGRLYRPEDFHFMPPLDPDLEPLAEPTSAAKAQLASCNRIHGNRRRITCMQWHVGGLSRHRLDELKHWLSTQHVQVITLIETRWTYTGEWLDPEWSHIHSGHPASRGNGILTLISRRLCSDRDIRWQESGYPPLVDPLISFVDTNMLTPGAPPASRNVKHGGINLTRCCSAFHRGTYC